MEFRNILISSPARLSLRHNSLVVRQEQETLIPLEDISALMVESRQTTLSAALLEALATAGVTVFFCDEKHLPAAQLLAYHQFCRQKKLLYAQLNVSKPLQKQIWKAIVRRKIENQARCLQYANREGTDALLAMAAKVHSGDTENVEAAAAAFYFKKLFGPAFTRGREVIENAALNYGYAIVRGCVARNLVMHGLDPAIGLHHHSELNAFNLADDLIEPFRPVVDLYVAQSLPQMDEAEELCPAMKRGLFNITNMLVRQNGKNFRTMLAVDRAAASLAACLNGGTDLPELPELLPLTEGSFE